MSDGARSEMQGGRKETAVVDTEEIMSWASAQEWTFEHDADGWDGYCVIQRLCDEVQRLRVELDGRSDHA